MLKPIPSADQRGRDHHSQCRLEVFGEHHRRINPSEAGGYGLKAVIASAAKQSSVANTRAGLLRRFATRDDEKRLGRPKWPNSETTASRAGGTCWCRRILSSATTVHLEGGGLFAMLAT